MRRKLEARAAKLEHRLEAGHRNPGTVTMWRRELLRTRCMLLALADGRRPADWDLYRDQVGPWPPITH